MYSGGVPDPPASADDTRRRALARALTVPLLTGVGVGLAAAVAVVAALVYAATANLLPPEEVVAAAFAVPLIVGGCVAAGLVVGLRRAGRVGKDGKIVNGRRSTGSQPRE